MSPEDQARRAGTFRADPHGEPLAVVLYRLEQIERRMDRLLSAELHQAKHTALSDRVDTLERVTEESARTVRQVVVGVIVAVGGALVTAGITIM